MKGQHLVQLLAAASAPLAPPLHRLLDDLLALAGDAAHALQSLLHARNGWLAYDEALHVFACTDVGPDPAPWRRNGPGYDLTRWNSPTQWRAAYGERARDGLFFAETVIGEQFLLDSRGHVWHFDAETGDRAELAASLDGWARCILADPDRAVGATLARAWRRKHGPLRPGQRLLPIIPLSAGGAWHVDNVEAVDAVQGMSARAHAAVQIVDLPSGVRVRLVPGERRR